MMDFITVPATCGVIFYFVYKVFELLVRRRERLSLIDKFSSNAHDGGAINLPEICFEKRGGQFLSLRFGAILLGIGFGIAVGFIVSSCIYPTGLLNMMQDWQKAGLSSLIVGACTLFFGGLGMLISFVIERKLSK